MKYFLIYSIKRQLTSIMMLHTEFIEVAAFKNPYKHKQVFLQTLGYQTTLKDNGRAWRFWFTTNIHKGKQRLPVQHPKSL